jgi:hypothetical protein
VPGVIKVGPFNMPVGRIELMWFNLTVSQIGKVYAGNLYYWDPKTKAEYTTSKGFEVLACQDTCVNGGSGPYCCKNGANSEFS